VRLPVAGCLLPVSGKRTGNRQLVTGNLLKEVGTMIGR
jgi:hypothetical protein